MGHINISKAKVVSIMVRKISEIKDILKDHSNMDENSKDIVLFNIMSGSCSRNCPNCYDRHVKKEVMQPDVFENYLTLVEAASAISGSNVSPRISTIASKIIEYPYLREYLDSIVKHKLVTSVYVSDLGTVQLMHPAIDLIYFHITNSVSDIIDTFRGLELAGKRMDLRFNFSADKSFKEQTDIIYNFIETIGNDSYLLRYSISSKTLNEESLHFTPDNFEHSKNEFFGHLEKLSLTYPNLKFRAERPFFKCIFTQDEIREYSAKFGLTFDCVMEFTVTPNGSCGLCPPVMQFTNSNSIPHSIKEFINELARVKELYKELCLRPSFDRCKKCTDKCQGGCLSYKF